MLITRTWYRVYHPEWGEWPKVCRSFPTERAIFQLSKIFGSVADPINCRMELMIEYVECKKCRGKSPEDGEIEECPHSNSLEWSLDVGPADTQTFLDCVRWGVEKEGGAPEVG